jgi:hypothetical protein
LHGRVPVDACISDADTLLQTSWAFRRDLLVTLVNIRLDHDTNDGGLASTKLLANDSSDLGLVAMILVGVAYSLLLAHVMK